MAVIETLFITPLSLDQIDHTFIAAHCKWDGPAAFPQGMLDWYRTQDPGLTDQTPLLAERFRVVPAAP